MKIIIQTPDFKPNAQLLDFIKKEVEKLSHLSDRTVEIRLCLKIEKSDARANKICEITSVMPGKDLFVKKQASTFEQATVEAVHALKRQITNWTERKSQRR